MIGSTGDIEDLMLLLMRHPLVAVTSVELRVLEQVLLRIGPGGFCWAPALDIALAARVQGERGEARVDAVRRILRMWSESPMPANAARGILQRLEARSGVAFERRHVLYFCPRLTGIPAPMLPRGFGWAVLIPCEQPECEPELVIPALRIPGDAELASRGIMRRMTDVEPQSLADPMPRDPSRE